MQGLEGQKSKLQKDSLKTWRKCLYIQLFCFHTNLSSIWREEGGIASQHSIWHRGKTKWMDDKRSLVYFVFLMDETGL